MQIIRDGKSIVIWIKNTNESLENSSLNDGKTFYLVLGEC